MPSGGARKGAGGPRLTPEMAAVKKLNRIATKAAVEIIAKTQAAGVLSAENSTLTPLEYMMALIRNPLVDEARRDKLAIAAAPYFHKKLDGGGIKGKKDAQNEAAKDAAIGKFRSGQAPRLTAVNNAA